MPDWGEQYLVPMVASQRLALGGVPKLTFWAIGPKMANFWPKMPFLAMGGREGPKRLVQVEQMVIHIGTHVGGLLWMQNSSENCTQWCRKGPKMAHFWPNMPFLAIGGREGPKWLAQVEQIVVIKQ